MYREAREKGVVFLRYKDDIPPEVRLNGDKIIVEAEGYRIWEPDCLVLSAATLPGDFDDISKIFKLPLNEDKFFLEAHPKLRPIDFPAEGFFLAGLAHSPKTVYESIAQGYGAALRAVTLLSKDKIESSGITAVVNERLCAACGVCISTCPYDARYIDEDENVAKIHTVQCQGCGACVVACPNSATEQNYFRKNQMMAMLEVL